MILKNSPILFATIISCIHVAKSADTSIPKILQTLRNILHSSNYSSDIRPTDESNSPVLVKVNMLIRELHDIDDDKMQISMQVTLRMKWKDDRLAYEAAPGFNYVTLNEETRTNLWIPDLFFVNEASSMSHVITKPNFYIRVSPDGQIKWSSRYSLVFFCPMDFKLFPFDKQRCSIQMSSYAETKENLILTWDDTDSSPVKILTDENKPISRFEFLGYGTDEDGLESVRTYGLQDTYSHVMIYIDMQRRTGYYIIQMFTPLFIFTILSFVSFWLGQNPNTRLSLTLTILLTMATSVSGFNQNMPKVTYVRAVDIWSGFSMILVCCSIIESAVIAFWIQKDRQLVEFDSFSNVGSSQPKIKKGLDLEKSSKVTPGLYYRRIMKLDRISQIVFPICYALFLVGYAFTYGVFDKSM